MLSRSSASAGDEPGLASRSAPAGLPARPRVRAQLLLPSLRALNLMTTAEVSPSRWDQTKIALIVAFWIGTVVASFWSFMRPVAPCTAVLMLLAGMTGSGKRWWVIGLHAFLVPAAWGSAVFAGLAFVLHLVGVRGRELPAMIETLVVTTGVLAEPIAEMSLQSWLIIAGVLILGGFYFGKWAIAEKVTRVLAALATVYAGLVVFASFSFFGAPNLQHHATDYTEPVLELAHRLGRERQEWEERADKAELLGPKLLESIRKIDALPRVVRELASFASKEDAERSSNAESDPEVLARWVVRDRIDRLRSEFYGRPAEPAPFLRRSGGISRWLKTARPGLAADVAPRASAASVPSARAFREVRAENARLPARIQAAQTRVAVQLSLVRSTFTALVGENIPVSGKIASQLNSAFLDAIAESVPLEDFRRSASSRGQSTATRTWEQTRVLHEEHVSWNRTRGTRRQAELHWNQNRAEIERVSQRVLAGEKLSEGEMTLMKKTPRRHLATLGVTCDACGLPFWFPGCR